MKVLTIGNLKGGVGKTTSTVNLACTMAAFCKRVLVVDLDPQANLTPFFRKVNYGEHTIKSVYRSPEKSGRAIYRSKYKDIDIIKGDTSLRENDAADEKALQTVLQRVTDKYDVCLIDTRPAFENLTMSALYVSNMLVTPVCLDKFCRDNLLAVEEQVDGIFQTTGIKLEWRIFANKVENKRTQRQIYKDMVEYHAWPFLDCCISNGAVMSNALDYYKPVIRHRSGSPLVQDYIDLAKELLEVLEHGEN
ncbi:ParA family protein [Muricomes intestini]|jgi:chromosome partitioning protein|uniref:ParA family protein n=1 Tax=Muricomes intestini TaxID=1796634 RepID=UPI002FE3E1DC